MKKFLTIIALTSIFILTGCNKETNEENISEEYSILDEEEEVDEIDDEIENVDTNNLKSENRFLQYTLPNGWRKLDNDAMMITEIYVANSDQTLITMIDFIDYSLGGTEEFMALNEVFTLDTGAVWKEDIAERDEDNNRTITAKIYEMEDATDQKIILGFAEEDDNKDGFLGFTVLNFYNENGINEFFEFLKTIEFTGDKPSDERIYISDDETFQVTLPPNWKKSGLEDYAFYKTDGELLLYANFSQYDKANINPDEAFEDLLSSMETSIYFDRSRVDIEIEELEDRKITRFTCAKPSSDGVFIKSYCNLVEFNDSDKFYTVIYDTMYSDVVEEGDNYVMWDFSKIDSTDKTEFDYMTNSIVVN